MTPKEFLETIIIIGIEAVVAIIAGIIMYNTTT